MVHAAPVVITNTSKYQRGDEMTVTISGATPQGVVSLWIEKSGIWMWAHQGIADASGDYTYIVKIPLRARPHWYDGSYQVKVYDKTTDTIGQDSFSIYTYRPPAPPLPPPPVVNNDPIAVAGSDQVIFVGSTLYFDGSGSTDSDGTVDTYLWIFGDGHSETGVTVPHSYTSSGVYTVSLTVIDNNGATGVDELNVTVVEPPLEPEHTIDVGIFGENEDFTVDASDLANIVVYLNTTDTVTVSILAYHDNPYPEVPLPLHSIPLIADLAISDLDAVVWPIYVEMMYADENVTEVDESKLGLYYYKSGEWRRCRETGVYPSLNKVWANMYDDEVSGSPILVSQGPEEASFVVSDLHVGPSSVEIDEEVSVTVNVENIGEEAGNVTISVMLDDELLESRILHLGGGNYTLVEFTITSDVVGSHSVDVDGLSSNFTVLPPPAPAEFQVSNLQVSPEEIVQGDEVTVSVSIANIGDESGEFTVTLELDGTEIDTESGTLGGGESAAISFTTSSDVVGSHSVDVGGLTSSFTVLSSSAPAEFQVSNLQVSPEEVEPGEEVTVSLTVTNIGDEAGTHTVVLLLDDTELDSDSVTVNGGDSTQLSFTISSIDEGSHTIEVEELTGQFSVIVQPEPPGFPWIWVDLLIVVVVIAAVYILRKRGII